MHATINHHNTSACFRQKFDEFFVYFVQTAMSKVIQRAVSMSKQRSACFSAENTERILILNCYYYLKTLHTLWLKFQSNQFISSNYLRAIFMFLAMRTWNLTYTAEVHNLRKRKSHLVSKTIKLNTVLNKNIHGAYILRYPSMTLN
jgi:hypothetical protein